MADGFEEQLAKQEMEKAADELTALAQDMGVYLNEDGPDCE